MTSPARRRRSTPRARRAPGLPHVQRDRPDGGAGARRRSSRSVVASCSSRAIAWATCGATTSRSLPAAGTAYPGGGGTYGAQTCFPLPDVERINNPEHPEELTMMITCPSGRDAGCGWRSRSIAAAGVPAAQSAGAVSRARRLHHEGGADVEDPGPERRDRSQRLRDLHQGLRHAWPPGSTTPVNEQTLFEIGSSSKAFTATLAAMLVTDGKMRWDDRLTTYLPDFRMYDPVANAAVTLRDALTHRSGIARGELVWLGANISRDEVLHRVRFLKPESPFRSHYSYQNMMFLAAGQAEGKAAGTTWDDLVRQRIFMPLGMTSTVTTSKGLDERERRDAARHGSRHAGDEAAVQWREHRTRRLDHVECASTWRSGCAFS